MRENRLVRGSIDLRAAVTAVPIALVGAAQDEHSSVPEQRGRVLVAADSERTRDREAAGPRIEDLGRAQDAVRCVPARDEHAAVA